MRKIYRLFVGVFLFFMISTGWKKDATAAEISENVNITIPTEMSIVFEEDGTNSMNEFTITNNASLSMEITSVLVKTFNDWELITCDTEILANRKQLALEVEGHWLHAGENSVNIAVPEQSEKQLQIGLKRGAWTEERESETAFCIELEYHFVSKQFQISFNSNGSEKAYEAMSVYNGTIVTLPIPERFGYDFVGWMDAEGNVFSDSMEMPIGDVSLTAQWVKTDAYAIYFSENQSLVFVRSSKPPEVGATYDGKVISKVYTGFEEEVYTDYTKVPWLRKEENFGNHITKVIMQDPIRPLSTENWFFCLRNCTYFDVAKLDTSHVTSMYCMFSSAGCDVTSDVTLKGISNWDTSNVQNMFALFRGLGERAETFVFDDISGWDTSNVTNMAYMFCYTGQYADWELDLSRWDVSQVTDYTYFKKYVESKIISPNW